MRRLVAVLAVLPLALSAKATAQAFTHVTFGEPGQTPLFSQSTSIPSQTTANSSFQLLLQPNVVYQLSFDTVARGGEGMALGSFGAVAELVVSIDVGTSTLSGSGLLFTEDLFPPTTETQVVGLPPWNDAVQSSGSQPGFSSWVRSQGSATIAGPLLTFTLSSRAQSARTQPGTGPVKADVVYTLTLQSPQATTIIIQATATVSTFGSSQSLPTLPTAGNGTFLGGPSGNWFDPPLALGYDFQQTGASLFTDILTLPVGIDGDGLFEVQVGNLSLGQFAEGTGVNFVQVLSAGVPAFRIVGIDPAVDATDVEAFPVQLAFDTQFADFTMTPVTWRAVGTSCSDAVCASCPTTSIAPIGDAVEGNLAFGIGLSNGPANGAAGFYVGLGSASTAPFPLFCGSVLLPLQNAFFDVGATLLPGSGTCDGAGSIALPLVPTPPLFGLFLTLQAITLCPQGGLGLTHAIEFPIGS